MLSIKPSLLRIQILLKFKKYLKLKRKVLGTPSRSAFQDIILLSDAVLASLYIWLKVTLTALMTSVVMVLLMVLMRMKMKKKKRLSKKINPSVLFTVDRDEIGQNQTNMESLSVNGKFDTK